MTIQFSVVGGGPIGTATLTGSTASYSAEPVRNIMTATIARVGVTKAFERFSDWSNGYVVAKAI